MWMCGYVSTCASTRGYMWTCICVFDSQAWILVHMCVLPVYLHDKVCSRICIYIYIYIYMCVCVCVCISTSIGLCLCLLVGEGLLISKCFLCLYVCICMCRCMILSPSALTYVCLIRFVCVYIFYSWACFYVCVFIWRSFNVFVWLFLLFFYDHFLIPINIKYSNHIEVT